MKHVNAILTETSHPAKPQNLGAAPSAGHTIRDRSAKQRAFGPVSASKTQPTLARLRDVLTDLKVHGTCRHVAYELLTYWEPGGTVFPSVKTLAEGAVLRCQWHTRENVVSYVAKSEQPVWRQRLQRAYNRPEYDEALAALKSLQHELEDRNQSAAGSLAEGLDETLTLHRLGGVRCAGPVAEDDERP